MTDLIAKHIIAIADQSSLSSQQTWIKLSMSFGGPQCMDHNFYPSTITLTSIAVVHTSILCLLVYVFFFHAFLCFLISTAAMILVYMSLTRIIRIN